MAVAILPRTTGKPTCVRYGVPFGFAASLSMITFMDRACMITAGNFVHDLNLSSIGELNMVFMAFNLAYALC